MEIGWGYSSNGNMQKHKKGKFEYIFCNSTSIHHFRSTSSLSIVAVEVVAQV